MSKPEGCTCTSIASLVRLDRYERKLLRAGRCVLMDRGIFKWLAGRLEELKEDRARLDATCPLHGTIHKSRPWRELERSLVLP